MYFPPAARTAGAPAQAVERHDDRHADRHVTTTVIGGGAVQRVLLLCVRQRNDAKLVPDTLTKIHNTEMSLNRKNGRTWKTTWTAELLEAAKGKRKGVKGVRRAGGSAARDV